MNERIRQLADRAHVTVLTTKGMENVLDGCYLVSPDKLQEFAELIVKECASMAANFSMENKRFHPDSDPVNMPIGQRMVYHSTCQSVSYEIKQHFGVEL